MKNRKIKYRVWVNNEMIYIKEGVYISFFNAENAVDWAIYDRLDGHTIYKHDSTYPEDLKNNHLMQFTGLKDKNDKEIYEGDWVEDNVGRLWLIKFNDEVSCFCFYWKGKKMSWQNFMQFNSLQKPFTIVGNIHESNFKL